MGGIQNVNNKFIYPKQMPSLHKTQGPQKSTDIDAAAVSGAAFAAGAQRLQPTLPLQPPAQAQGIQATGANKSHGDEFTRFLSDRAKSQHGLGYPRAAEGLGTRLDTSF
jgi:hypothetical protein